ncbi:MAG: deoxyribodipyrimidine photo-lyase [Phycisphaerales bacterium JB039]
MRPLIWFRTDLRRRDNLALARACARADRGAIACFLISPDQWRQHDWADIKVEFLLRNLRDLSEGLARLNIPLLIREVPRFDGAADVICAICEQHACDALFFNREYEVNERARDEAVEQALRARGRAVHAFDDQTIIAPGRVRTQQDGVYSVFTPFKKAWLTTLEDSGGADPVPTPTRQAHLDITPDPIPDSIDGFDLSRGRPDLWPAGEDHAASRLDAFIDRRIARYHEDRDSPAINGTSTISPYLTLGVISPRQCLAAAADAAGGALPGPKDRSGPAVWISELIWREFYKHLMFGMPRLSRNQPMKIETRKLKWRESDDDLAAWKEGRTGVPIVDAGMRQLAQTGWMHNRVRMITAMFLTKNLLIHWRQGERHFMRHLVDGDLASNNGGWQWSASTGADAAPYFRIFNPITQGQRHDPEAKYLKRFLPELESLDPASAHDPSPDDRARLDYPDPICDLKATRQRAIEAFQAIA